MVTTTGLLSRAVDWWTSALFESRDVTYRGGVRTCRRTCRWRRLRHCGRPCHAAAHSPGVGCSGTRNSPPSVERIASSCSGWCCIFLSGVLLAAADLPTYMESRVFWTKMALVAALLVQRHRPGSSRTTGGVGRSWIAPAATGVGAQLALWFLTTLLGTALPNVG